MILPAVAGAAMRELGKVALDQVKDQVKDQVVDTAKNAVKDLMPGSGDESQI